MNRRLLFALVGGIGFYGVWIALTLQSSTTNTLSLLIVGAASGAAFASAMYWVGGRKDSVQEHEG